MNGKAAPPTSWSLPAGIWALGFVSLLMDISSEMIHALLPVYLVAVLGASATTIGIIEGIAEATASIVKVFSGALSDWIGRRKGLTALGYGLAALTKPVFPLAAGIGWIVAARFIDRVGKGIRGAPRDALIADLAGPGQRGAAFGLRQSLDTLGALLGPLIAIALMALTADAYRTVFWIAVVPATLALALVLFAVREPPRPAGLRSVAFPLRRNEIRRLPAGFWRGVGLACVFTLARFSEAFLLLRAQGVGMPVTWVPLVLVVMNAVYAVVAYPAGRAADRGAGRGLLAFGLLALVAADLVLAFTLGLGGVIAGVALWGLHLGLTQGQLIKWVADTAPAELRGTAFGVFHLATGVALLGASAGAGFLWEWLGPRATFLAGAALAALAWTGMVLSARSRRPSPDDRPA